MELLVYNKSLSLRSNLDRVCVEWDHGPQRKHAINFFTGMKSVIVSRPRTRRFSPVPQSCSFVENYAVVMTISPTYVHNNYVVNACRQMSWFEGVTMNPSFNF